MDGGLPRVRYAQPYEELRDRSDAHLAEHGDRPKIFLATLGPVATDVQVESLTHGIWVGAAAGSSATSHTPGSGPPAASVAGSTSSR